MSVSHHTSSISQEERAEMIMSHNWTRIITYMQVCHATMCRSDLTWRAGQCLLDSTIVSVDYRCYGRLGTSFLQLSHAWSDYHSIGSVITWLDRLSHPVCKGWVPWTQFRCSAPMMKGSVWTSSDFLILNYNNLRYCMFSVFSTFWYT